MGADFEVSPATAESLIAQCRGLRPAATGVRPGTLTVTVGRESVTLDPLDPDDKFDADAARVRELLARFQ